MPSFFEAEVSKILVERRGLQRVEVVRSSGNDPERAYVLTQTIGPVRVGDRVVINTTAVDLGLGTGGWHVVHWNLSRSEWTEPGPGHVMKLRYTSLQLDTGVVEEQGGRESVDLSGTPVVVCLLHSQVAAVAVAAKHVRPGIRIAYVMTDQASLPLALSDLMHELTARGIIDATISAGQAFGGDFEAVNPASALEIAKSSAAADLIVVAQGPGVVGTGTELGFGGLEMVGVLDDIVRSKAHPFLALRWSGADPRPRHRGMSHHSRTLLERTSSRVTVAVPEGCEEPDVSDHDVHTVEVPDMQTLFTAQGLEVTSMGRSPSQDPGFFAFAGAAGTAAASLLDTPVG